MNLSFRVGEKHSAQQVELHKNDLRKQILAINLLQSITPRELLTALRDNWPMFEVKTGDM